MGICCSMLGATECCGAVIKREYLDMKGKWDTELTRANGLQEDKTNLLGKVANLESNKVEMMETMGELRSQLMRTQSHLGHKTEDLAHSRLYLATDKTKKILQESKAAWIKLSKKVKNDLLNQERIQSELKSQTIAQQEASLKELTDLHNSLKSTFELFVKESNMQLEHALMLQLQLMSDVEATTAEASETWQEFADVVAQRQTKTLTQMEQQTETRTNFGEFIKKAFGAILNEDGTITVNRRATMSNAPSSAGVDLDTIKIEEGDEDAAMAAPEQEPEPVKGTSPAPASASASPAPAADSPAPVADSPAPVPATEEAPATEEQPLAA